MEISIKTRDVLHFLDTGEVENRNTTNMEAMKQFLEELELQEQINETEVEDDDGGFAPHA